MQVLKQRVVLADAELAEQMGVKPGQQWHVADVLRFLPNESAPMAFMHIYVRPEHSDVLRYVDTAGQPVFALIERRHGVRIAEVRQQIVAVTLGPADARRLKARTGAPALHILRQYFDAQDRLVMASRRPLPERPLQPQHQVPHPAPRHQGFPMKPLSGVRIVSVEQFGAAPYGSMFLADLGAEVIKVENAAVGGDPARQAPGPTFSARSTASISRPGTATRRAWRSTCAATRATHALRQLIAQAEVVLNNLRGDLPAKLGLDYQTLSAHQALDRLRPPVGVRPRQRARGLARLRLPDAGRVGPHGSHRRTRRPADAHRRPVDDRPRDRPHRDGRPARRARAGARHRQGLRRRHLPVRRRAAPARLRGDLVPERGLRAGAPDAQRALLASRPCRPSRAPTAGSS